MKNTVNNKEKKKKRYGGHGTEPMDCIIVGGGAAGMAAAISAREHGAESVLLLEKNDCLGKKLKQTGNGRCNFTNRNMQESCFRSESKNFISSFLKRFSFSDCIDFFHSLGVLEKYRGEYVYPHSDQAKSLVLSLEKRLGELAVLVKLSAEVESISYAEGRSAILPEEKDGESSGLFQVQFADRESGERSIVRGKALLLTTGGLAMPASGSTGDGYTFAKQFGHTLVRPVPSLCPIFTEEKYTKIWAGVRTDCRLSLFDGEELLYQDKGELQCTDYGISGIVVFQCSRLVANLLERKRKSRLFLSFLPEYEEESFYSYLLTRKREYKNRLGRDLLLSILPDKLSYVLFQKASFPEEKKLQEIPEEKIKELCRMLFHFPFIPSAVSDFSRAQCTAGGVSLSQLDYDSLESLCCKGLYFAGEILDVDGICGGYNLHFAFGTGKIAGEAMGKRR